MNITKNQWIAIGVVGAVAVWYFFLRKKKMESGYDSNLMIIGNESGFKWPSWIKIGGCRPCVGSIHDGCCNGCVCKDKAN